MLYFLYYTIIKIISKDESNRISKIKIGNNEYTGVELRNILDLRSADFDIEKTENGIKITTRGYGHGVGMSQYGANGMANSGYSYDDILKHYYTGINIVK
jgi:stage II sporulation protein D